MARLPREPRSATTPTYRYVRELRAAGVKLAMITEKTGVPATTVWEWTKDIRVERMNDPVNVSAARSLRRKGVDLQTRRQILRDDE